MFSIFKISGISASYNSAFCFSEFSVFSLNFSAFEFPKIFNFSSKNLQTFKFPRNFLKKSPKQQPKTTRPNSLRVCFSSFIDLLLVISFCRTPAHDIFPLFLYASLSRCHSLDRRRKNIARERSMPRPLKNIKAFRQSVNEFSAIKSFSIFKFLQIKLTR